MLAFTIGNMFDIDADILVNTINCVGAMGCGVALAFKKRYPDMFADYKRACKNSTIFPGKLWLWFTDNEKVIVNFPTKDHWKNPSKYSWIENGLKELRQFLVGHAALHNDAALVNGEKPRLLSVVVPALGCGHGGLSWDVVQEMIKEYLDNISMNIFIFSPISFLELRRD